MSDDRDHANKKGPRRPANPIDDLFGLANLGAQVLVNAGEVLATSTRIAANVIDEIEREVQQRAPDAEPTPDATPRGRTTGASHKKKRPHHTAPPPDAHTHTTAPNPTPSTPQTPTHTPPHTPPSSDTHPALRRFLARRTPITLEDRHPYTEKTQHLALRPDGSAHLTLSTPDRQDAHTGTWHTSPATRPDALWLDVEAGPHVFRFRLSVDPDAPHHVYLDEDQARFGLAGKHTRRFDVD